MKLKPSSSNASTARRAVGRAARFVWNGDEVTIHQGTGPVFDISLPARPEAPDAGRLSAPEGRRRRREDDSGEA